MVAEIAQTPSQEPEAAATVPRNIDAEQAILGALLYENATYHRIADWLKPEHFHDPVHARIFEAIGDQIGIGNLCDPITLKAKLEQDDGLAQIGGTAYLIELVQSAPLTSNAAVEYGRMVRETFLRREVIRVGNEMAGDAVTDQDVDAHALIEHAESQLFSLAEQKTGSRGYLSFKEHTATMLSRAASAYESDGAGGIPTGIKTLDTKFGGLHPSDLIILAARPSIGKTALATNIAESAAREGHSVGFPSLEMAGDQISQRIIADLANVPSWKIRQGVFNQDEFERVREAALKVSELPLHIDDTGGISINALCSRARRLKRSKGLDLLIVDYLQLVTPSKRTRGDNRVQEVSEISAALKALAKELEIPVLALSQLSRQVENRQDKRPQLSDLRESGSIEQDADGVLFLYRDAYYREREKPQEGTPEYLAWEDEFRRIQFDAEVIIGKQRHGPIGICDLHFNGERMRFSDREDHR